MLKRRCKTFAILLAILLKTTLFAQERDFQIRFDSLYHSAMSSLATDVRNSVKCLETLSAYGDELSMAQQAWLSYLQMRIIESNQAALSISGKNQFAAPDSLNHPDSLQFAARRYLERSLPDQAIPLLMRAIEILPANNDGADHVRIELCEAYRQKLEYSKGISLIYRLLERSVPLSDKNQAYAWNRLAALYNESGNPPESYRDSVFKYSLLCQELSEKTSNKRDLATSQNELSYQYIMSKNYDKALDLSQKSVSNFLAAGLPFQAMNSLINQGNIYIRKKDYHPALESLDQATRLSPLWKNRNLYMRIYEMYAIAYAGLGKYRDAYEFQNLYNLLRSEFYRDRMNSQIIEQSARYDLFVKEQKIIEEQKKNEFNHRQIILLIIISITLTLAFVFSLFYFRLRRQKALKQKLIEAVVETENNERRRIARDLHDGLGPVISAINHYFQAFLDAKPENREPIRNRLQIVISEAIDEVSRISHNISPHVLEKHGLITALNNLLAPLMSNEQYEVSFTAEVDVKLDQKIELAVYRCITELINNTMKHAEATKIGLNIAHSEGKLVIRYSDNGKGFTASPGKRMGQGIPNITNRVESFGGTLSFVSSPDAGISVDIIIPL
jgi:signal transduction histidine kinase